MSVTAIDVLKEPFHGPAAWKGAEMAASDEWIHRLTPVEVAELDAALRAVQARGLAVLDVSRQEFVLPTLAPVLAGFADQLDNGRGFLLIKGFPVERYTEDEASTVYWGIGQHLGVPVSQNGAGHVLGHVRDTGKNLKDPSVRGYQTKALLPFHTDGSDVVGLLCFRPARSGGLSCIVSSTAIYNEVLRHRPELVGLLYEPWYFDRRGEQGEGQRPYWRIPLACWYDHRLSMRYVRGYIESAQRFNDVPRLTAEQIELLDLIDEIAASDEFRLDMDFEVGDMQFVSNYTVLHSRTDYDDFEEPELKRHLLRLWLTLRDGRGLSPAFAGDRFSRAPDGGRGGIVARAAG